jgi:hypothetical protein
MCQKLFEISGLDSSGFMIQSKYPLQLKWDKQEAKVIPDYVLYSPNDAQFCIAAVHEDKNAEPKAPMAQVPPS